MPTYDYECRFCGRQFEIFHSIKESSRTQCEECKQDGLQRIVSSPVGIVFKGSGFYVNDSRKKSATPKVSSKNAETEKKKGEKPEMQSANNDTPSSAVKSNEKETKKLEQNKKVTAKKNEQK